MTFSAVLIIGCFITGYANFSTCRIIANLSHSRLIIDFTFGAKFNVMNLAVPSMKWNDCFIFGASSTFASSQIIFRVKSTINAQILWLFV